MTTAALQRFAELSEQKSELDAQVNKIKAELRGLNGPVLEHMIDAGQQSIKLDNGRSVYIERTFWAGLAEDVNNEQAVEVLRAAGWGQFATFNRTSLSAEVRELPKDDDGKPILPDAIAGVIAVTETIKPRSRKAS